VRGRVGSGGEGGSGGGSVGKRGGRGGAAVRGARAEYVLAEAAAVSRTFKQPHLHVLGEVVGGVGFPDGVTCRFALEAGVAGDLAWEKSEGEDAGQTQVAYSEEGDGADEAVWAHPLDVHFLAGSLRGWPRMTVEVWRLDEAGRMEICGYGMCHVPSTPGVHDVDIVTWRPIGTPLQELAALYIGGAPRLSRASYVYSRRTERHELLTTGSGTVRVRFELVMRNFPTHGVELL
jgi:B9 domain-containing protein 2